MANEFMQQRTILHLAWLITPYMCCEVPDHATRLDVTLYTQLSVSRLLNLLRAGVAGNKDDMWILRNCLNNAAQELKQRKYIWIYGVNHTGVSKN